MLRWSIRTKILLFSLLPTLAIALLLAVAFVSNRLADLDAQLMSTSAGANEHFAKLAEYSVLTGNTNQLIVLCSSIREKENITSATVYGHKGQILAHSGPRVSEPYTIPASFTNRPTIYRSDQLLRFSTPIKLQDLSIIDNSSQLTGAELFTLGSTLGWAIVEVSEEALWQEKVTTIGFALAAILVSVIVCVVLAWYLTNNLTKPLSRFSKALTAIEKGKLDTRLHMITSPEFSTLQEGINSLAESLARARTEMQENIDQATHDLRETLETIEIQNIELDIARKEALEASQVKSEFLANMSHEIRTPLNGIIGFTKLLSKSALSVQQRDQLDTILKSSEILLTIINDILDFSKIEAGKLILDNVPLKLNELVEDVLTMLAPGAHKKNLDLAGLVYSDVPPVIHGDPLRLKQIITNLVSNSIKFSEQGEVVVRVMLDDEDEDHQKSLIKITVTDSGVGLSRVQQQTLFSAFSQADVSTARRFGGTGLGLVISRRLTEQMGGQIGAESELGRGSEFWITLPVETSCPAYETSDSLPVMSRERFIYWDSQPKIKLAVSHVLEKWGAHYDIVANLSQMVEQVYNAQQERNGYSAAIIGISKNQLKSAELLETVQRLEYQLDCRTLLLTPTVDAGADQPPVLSEASNYLIKPPSQRRLANTLNQLIRGSNSPVPERAEATTIAATGENMRKPRILAVDDNSANLKLVKAFLEDLNVIVETAVSGYEAINKVKLRRYDLIFMDVQMPGMDGIATTAKIREFEVGKKSTPIVALTAHALSDEKALLLASGFDGYLTKPTNEDELQATIAAHTAFSLDQNADQISVETRHQVKFSVNQALAPSVDISAGIQLAGQKPDLAEELFSMLLESLPGERESIISSHKNAEFEKLLETVHRLHGATRYCGVPPLRKFAAELESCLKRKSPHIERAIKLLLDEIERVIYWADLHNWQQDFRSYEAG